MHVITESTITSVRERGAERHLGTLKSQVSDVFKHYPTHTFLGLTRRDNTIQIEVRGSTAPSKAMMNALRAVVQKREGPSVGLRLDLSLSFTSD